jgi:glyoxylate carboligase
MPSEAFDIACLVPRGIRRINLAIRLKSASVTITVFAAEEHLEKRTAPLGGAVLWRQGRGPVLISVPSDVQVVAIDVDADT